MGAGGSALDAWLAHESNHVPSARLQLLDSHGALVFDKVIGGADARFADVGVQPGDPAVAAGQSWSRDVTLVPVGSRVVVRAVSPGTYRVPPPLVEDMYRPDVRGIGRSVPATVKVVEP